MLILNTVQELENHLKSIRQEQKIIGFVPTMGALHQGHLHLVKEAKKSSDFVVCSIFVNPTQFNDLSDLAKYPRTLAADIELLKTVSCDAVFAPEVSEMYSKEELELKQKGIEDKSWTGGKSVDFGSLDKVMEGAHRPGHFNGVAQVVSKLFRVVQPHKAFFGQKDFQQLAIIKSMVNQLKLPVAIISCPTVREKDGLAMSSRNVRLTAQERQVAPLIYKVLSEVKNLAQSQTPSQLITYAQTAIAKEPKMTLEYFEIADTETLLPLKSFSETKKAVACIALKLGTVRLIDNIVI